jgi:hypothetical protein
MCCVLKSDMKEGTETDRQTEERVDICVDVCVSFCKGKQDGISGADGMGSLVREVQCFSSMGISER